MQWCVERQGTPIGGSIGMVTQVDRVTPTPPTPGLMNQVGKMGCLSDAPSWQVSRNKVMWNPIW